MRKLIYLVLTVLVVACSDDSSSDNGAEGIDPIIGIWTLSNEEWVGEGDWPEGQARGCYLESDEGFPDSFIFTELTVIHNVWECDEDGNLVSDNIVSGPIPYSNLGQGIYSFDEENYEVTFMSNNNVMQIDFFEDIIQTFFKNNSGGSNNDTTAPVITILGDANISIIQGTPYTDAGATATDNVDGNLTSSIVTSGTVNVNSIGSYTITYTVSDAAGNTATASRQVTVIEAAAISIGDIIEFGGAYNRGVVFWIDPADNTHGLICAFSDGLDPGSGTVVDASWDCSGTDIPGLPNVSYWSPQNPDNVYPGAEIGDGLNNTNNILISCPGSDAANLARGNIRDENWFVPSAKEMYEMYTQRSFLGGPGFYDFSQFYWTSTEKNSQLAWFQDMSNGNYDAVNKTDNNRVRPVRAF